jgi:hypothetical protein
MLRHSKKIEHSIETIKQIIIAHQKLFVEIYLRDSPEIEDIIHQMIHGRPQHKSIKLYQYLLESFLLSGGGDQSNQNYYANQQYQPSFNRVKRAVKTAQCPKLATFETFKRCGYRKGAKTCSEPAFLKECPLPAFDMKRGALNHMAFSLYFFLRDVCHGDFHEFVKDHFAADGTTTALLDGFITKVAAIENVGPKLAHMALAWLFLIPSCSL